jgi:hypothetical protein
MSAVRLAEALYHTRSAKDLKPRGLIRDRVLAVEHELVAALADKGHDGGESAADADGLKLELMNGASQKTESLPVDRLDALLEQAADVSGSENVFRELDRFATFCNRMRFAEPGAQLIDDDPGLPVYGWCRREGRAPGSDLAESAQLFLDWTTAALQQCWRGHGERDGG